LRWEVNPAKIRENVINLLTIIKAYDAEKNKKENNNSSDKNYQQEICNGLSQGLLLI
jgi:hypothetical protein